MSNTQLNFTTVAGRTSGSVSRKRDNLVVCSIVKFLGPSTRDRVNNVFKFSVRLCDANGKVHEGILATLPAAKKWAQSRYDQSLPKFDRDAELEAIARSEFGVDTLEVRGMDDLDFHDVSVAAMKDALRKAYELGRNSK